MSTEEIEALRDAWNRMHSDDDEQDDQVQEMDPDEFAEGWQ